MPRGPQGQKRPADVVGNAVRVMEIATGQGVEGSTTSALALAALASEIRAAAGPAFPSSA